MLFNKRKMMMLFAAFVTMSLTAGLPTKSEAGLFGKVTKAVIYPVKKVGSNASVDTHRAIQHNSVEPASGTNGSGEKQAVKPSGHKAPVSP